MELCDEYQIDLATGQAYALGQNIRQPLERWQAFALEQFTRAENRKTWLQFSDAANIRACVEGSACIAKFAATDAAGRALAFQLSPLIPGSQRALISVAVENCATGTGSAPAAADDSSTAPVENNGPTPAAVSSAKPAAAPQTASPLPADSSAEAVSMSADAEPLSAAPDEPGKPGLEILDRDRGLNAMIQTSCTPAYPLELEYELDLADIQKKAKTSRLLTLFGTFVLTVICFIVLYANAGWFRNYLGFYLPQTTAAPAKTETVESTRAHVEHDPVYIPFEQKGVLSMQVLHTGTPRLNDSSSTYNTLECTLTLTQAMGPSDFEADYAKDYTLSGTEACAVFTLSYTDVSEDADALASIVPQDAIEISMAGANGETVEEYQLSNKAVGGTYAVSLAEKKTKTFYKRFKASDAIRYLRVKYFVDGEVYYAYFALYQGDPKVTYTSLEKGNSGALVTVLQEKLLALGYLENVNGSFNSATKTAVELAQKANNLSQTGIADDALLHLLLDTST
ncbi:MAG TPA: peptidoglycan-binding protein [Candidatus Limiplasma sp.]|nr:peptidoglycan-binding protein [Candidatus Limiplasma sp.]